VIESPIARVLVVEHTHAIRHCLCLHLELGGYHYETAQDTGTALRRLAAAPFDLAIVDTGAIRVDRLPLDRDARERGANPDVRFLLLTEPSRMLDGVVALERGADAYLVKPFGLREFVARVRALLRTWPANGEGTLTGTRGLGAPIVIHGIEINPARRRVRLEEHDVKMTEQEFQLLYLLATHPGCVFTRDALMKHIWGPDTFVTTRCADTLVKRVRKRLEACTRQPRYVLTVRGVGYKFAA
jgi:DNA-binding response OmpR family regulator